MRQSPNSAAIMLKNFHMVPWGSTSSRGTGSRQGQVDDQTGMPTASDDCPQGRQEERAEMPRRETGPVAREKMRVTPV